MGSIFSTEGRPNRVEGGVESTFGCSRKKRCGKRLSGQGLDYVSIKKVRGSNFMFVIFSYG